MACLPLELLPVTCHLAKHLAKHVQSFDAAPLPRCRPAPGSRSSRAGADAPDGGVCCEAGTACVRLHKWYWQCLPAPGAAAAPAGEILAATCLFV
jgi:hypothetical protein